MTKTDLEQLHSIKADFVRRGLTVQAMTIMDAIDEISRTRATAEPVQIRDPYRPQNTADV